MSSLAAPTSTFAPDTRMALIGAIRDLAPRSLTVPVDPCEAGRFAELVEGRSRWFSAPVDFEDRDCGGSIRCLVPEDLAEVMRAVFSGRTAADLDSSPTDVSDVVGQFAHRVCDAWLRRVASGHTFSVRPQPVLASLACAPTRDESWTTVVVNDRPMAVAIRIGVPAETSM
jgi:hypothetical protein